ncbi:hypothetical protein BDY24DRAFT_285925 [Mrakia frigida]|uniref:uncharacterized protein n=1 Tax=Mrakia frigida TaxID=29902 RepID=UPI003FCBF93E
MATMFASDFSFSSAQSALPLPNRSSSSHSPITPLDIVFTTTTSPSHSNFYASPHLNSTDDDDDGGARAIVVSTGRRMSKSTKISPRDKMSSSPSISSYTTPPVHHFHNSPPPSYSSNERSHNRKSQPTPLELYAPTDLNDGRSRSSYFPTSPVSSGSRRGMSVSAQGSEVGVGGNGSRRMSAVLVGRERRSSVDQEKEDQRTVEVMEKKRRAVAAGPGTIGFESCIAGALAHEKKARSYGEGASTKALHHFTRASDLLSLALQERPDGLEALVYKSVSLLISALLFSSFPFLSFLSCSLCSTS